MDNSSFVVGQSLYRISPSSEEDVRWAAVLAKRVYEGFDVIPEETMVGWFNANPTGFSTLYRGEHRVGNFDILPLKPLFMRRFIEGSLLEVELPPEAMYSTQERGEIRDLYWESIVIDPSLAHARRYILKAVILSYKELIERMCELDQVDSMYAIAASAEGTAVVSALGMTALGDPAERRDAHQLYRGTLVSYAAAVARLGRTPAH